MANGDDENSNGSSVFSKDKRDFFFGTALFVSLLGEAAIGVCSFFAWPLYEPGVTAAHYTFYGIITYALGTKSALASPSNGHAKPTGSSTNGTAGN
jgi:hypothetical protein